MCLEINVRLDFCAGCQCSADQGAERGDWQAEEHAAQLWNGMVTFLSLGHSANSPPHWVNTPTQQNTLSTGRLWIKDGPTLQVLFFFFLQRLTVLLCFCDIFNPLGGKDCIVTNVTFSFRTVYWLTIFYPLDWQQRNLSPSLSDERDGNLSDIVLQNELKVTQGRHWWSHLSVRYSSPWHINPVCFNVFHQFYTNVPVKK